jgi:glutamine amidotransferase
VTDDPTLIRQADKLVLPGVGHFGKAMEKLHHSGLVGTLNEVVLEQGKPIMGICLGMQLMARISFESDDPQGTKGLGWFDAEVVKSEVNDSLRYKVPHTGWNSAKIEKQDVLLKDIPDQSDFYFVHAYHFRSNCSTDVLTSTTYEAPFVSAVSKGNIYGVQFHPEKSHGIGLKLLENFVKI